MCVFISCDTHASKGSPCQNYCIFTEAGVNSVAALKGPHPLIHQCRFVLGPVVSILLMKSHPRLVYSNHSGFPCSKRSRFQTLLHYVHLSVMLGLSLNIVVCPEEVGIN